MLRKKNYSVAIVIMCCVFKLFPVIVWAAEFKVLIIMSYEEDFPWCGEIREGIESVLTTGYENRYFYMNTKKELKDGSRKAASAYMLYQEFQPDGVIAADDNAQSMFVVPYLKDKVKTPVIFCGVNAEPEKYGYPASNVSGILERLHFDESIAFVQQLVPSVKNFGIIIKNSPTGMAHLEYVQKESHKYAAEFVSFKMPETFEDAVEMTKEMKKTCDLLFVAALQGMSDKNGNPVSEKKAVSMVVKTFGKPTVGTEEHNLKNGTLCTVVRTGQEQGSVAAEMLIKALQGTPVSQIPITRNYNGKRVLNVSAMKLLGIKPRSDILIGVELVRTEE